jgi:hypothetical protein
LEGVVSGSNVHGWIQGGRKAALLLTGPDLGHRHLDQEMSRYTALHPGDVLWMGTQGAEGDMFPGDTIGVEISGIGVLRNPVVAGE